MQFDIQDVELLSSVTLVYRPADHAFDVEPKPHGGGASLLVNDVQMEVDEDGRVLYVWGLCPQTSWNEQAIEPPQARKAMLIAELPDDFAPGMSMRLTKQPWPVAVDRKSRWIHIGAGLESDIAVEFAPGMIAALLRGELVGLWLRPRDVPRSG